MSDICLVREDGDLDGGVSDPDTRWRSPAACARAGTRTTGRSAARPLPDRRRARRSCALSRGQRSAVAVSIGIATRAPLTMFDEPHLGMDAPVALRVLRRAARRLHRPPPHDRRVDAPDRRDGLAARGRGDHRPRARARPPADRGAAGPRRRADGPGGRRRRADRRACPCSRRGRSARRRPPSCSATSTAHLREHAAAARRRRSARSPSRTCSSASPARSSCRERRRPPSSTHHARARRPSAPRASRPHDDRMLTYGHLTWLVLDVGRGDDRLRRASSPPSPAGARSTRACGSRSPPAGSATSSSAPASRRPRRTCGCSCATASAARCCRRRRRPRRASIAVLGAALDQRRLRRREADLRPLRLGPGAAAARPCSSGPTCGASALETPLVLAAYFISGWIVGAGFYRSGVAGGIAPHAAGVSCRPRCRSCSPAGTSAASTSTRGPRGSTARTWPSPLALGGAVLAASAWVARRLTTRGGPPLTRRRGVRATAAASRRS